MTKVTKGERIQQVLGILFLCLMYFMIIDKGFNDISALIQNNPDDFWCAFGRYIISNLAGG